MTTTAVVNSILENWVQVCQLEEIHTMLYYQEVGHLEIFDRLDMAHTCCMYTTTRAIKREDRG